MAIDRDQLDRAVDALRPDLIELAKKIHAEPELRYEEHRAVQWLAETLERHTGTSVERGTGGLATAFRAGTSERSGPRVAILAEYDALPQIGHACGHNLIAAGAVGAFLAIVEQQSAMEGVVTILGTPAEEGGGGKIRLIEAGVFEGLDAAMMFHPFDRDMLLHPALASLWIEFRFSGLPSHAAVAPWDGRSALSACLNTFQLIDSQRVHFRDGVRVHGFVTDGGQAVNVIPEQAGCELSVRARDAVELERVKEIVERCARGAALASGVEVSVSTRQGYREMRDNLAIARRFGSALEVLGRRPRERDDRVGAGSTDMGDVSHVVPSIHPYLAICAEGESMCHQRRFSQCANSDAGFETMLVAAKAMARTAADLVEDEDLREAARKEFEAR